MIIYIRNLTKRKVNLIRLKEISQKIAKELKLKGELSIVLVGSTRMRSLNKRFRGKDKTTDVLSFKENSFNAKIVMMEIFINLDDCQKISNYQDLFSDVVNSQDILHFLLIHALLHLKGLDDETEKKRQIMVERGIKIFKKFN